MAGTVFNHSFIPCCYLTVTLSRLFCKAQGKAKAFFPRPRQGQGIWIFFQGSSRQGIKISYTLKSLEKALKSRQQGIFPRPRQGKAFRLLPCSKARLFKFVPQAALKQRAKAKDYKCAIFPTTFFESIFK